MISAVRRYRTARLVFTIGEFLAWLLLAIGLIVAVIEFTTAGDASSSPTFPTRLLAALPGLAISLYGLFVIVLIQTARAVVDNAESNGQILALLQQRLEAPRQAESVEERPPAPAKSEPTPTPVPPAPAPRLPKAARARSDPPTDLAPKGKTICAGCRRLLPETSEACPHCGTTL